MSFLPHETQKFLLSIVEAIAPLAAWVNRRAIDGIVKRARSRPHPLSMQHDYLFWAGLSDLRWSARHLPPLTRASQAAPDALAALFQRKDGA